MRTTNRSAKRRGTILPLLAVTCFALFGFVALAVDIGMLMVARTECQNAADAAALAGARTLDNDVPSGMTEANYDNKRPQAIINATSMVRGNYLLRDTFAFTDSSIDKVEVGIYDYNTTTQVFQPTFPAANASDPSIKLVNNGSTRPWTAVRVTVKGDQPAYFARIFGITSMPMLARATSAHRPRDIAMVLDFSGSMNYGSTSHFPSGDGSSNGTVIGLLSTDPRYPQFGHYQRYDSRQQTNPNGSSPHPFRTTGNYTMGSGEVLSANNMTYTSSGGPPMVDDFQMSPNTNPAAAVNAATLHSAFNNPGTVLPKDATFNTQAVAFSTTETGPVGDRWPRKGGYRYDTTQTWDPNNTRGEARHAAELLNLNGSFPATPSERTIPAARPAIANGNRKEGSGNWRSFYDNAWETKGFDLDITSYISGGYATEALRTTELFQGYTIGPGYWGKSFFCWPPDPRFNSAASLTSLSTTKLSQDSSNRDICDWRRRFFLKGDGTAWNPQVDNINGTLLNTTSGGHTLNTNTANFRVNYPAVLAWLKSGPQTLPANLRAGRILFYTQIPDDCTNPTNNDQRFWREYIDYVLGVTRNRTWYNPAYCLAGTEGNAWGTFSLQSTIAYTPTGTPTPPENPKPYMCYTDTPNMPRAHFWFGPSSMLMFLTPRAGFTGSHAYNFNPGTVREAQCWQLKAAIQSGIDDIRKNHPNDQVGMSFFAYAHYTTPRVGMGQDWDRLKAALFYPNTFLDDVLAGNVREERPYTSDGNFNPRLVGNLPNANGATDPNNGLALAYNMPSSSTAVGAGGRRGSAKIVMFETDGVPNSYQNWDLTGSGTNTRYNWVDDGSSPGNGNSTCMNEAYAIVTQICASTTASSPGFSLPNAPARVYPFGFGDIFTSTSTFLPTTLTFLQTIAYNGNTSTSTSTPLPAEQVLTGSYDTRISNLRIGLERALQNGVQVTLIE